MKKFSDISLLKPACFFCKNSLIILVFLGVTAFAVCYNIYILTTHPDLGIDYVLFRRAELIKDTEGIKDFSKQELINLYIGDGMRFIAFLRKNLPDDSVVILPKDQFNKELRNDILGQINKAHMLVTLHPRRVETAAYDFRKLPKDTLKSDDTSLQSKSYKRDYFHSSRHFVFWVVTSPSCKRYRFFMSTAPVSGNKDYHTEITYFILPEII
jgi:hypothetical protein